MGGMKQHRGRKSHRQNRRVDETGRDYHTSGPIARQILVGVGEWRGEEMDLQQRFSVFGLFFGTP